MKTFLIIYGISWLILLAVYIASLFNKKKNVFSEKEPWYLYATIIAVAPLVVLLIPYLLISSFITQKKKKKYAMEQEKREAEEKARIQSAMQELNAAKSKPQENHSYANVMTAQTLVEKIKAKDYDSFMEYLDHLSLPNGESLQVEECSHEGHGDESKLFVETLEGAYDFNIWEYIKAENSTDGAWNAYFLYEVRHILPLWGHANYNHRIYMYSKEDAESIELFYGREEELPIIQRDVKQLISNPEVLYAANGKFFVSCCYWTNFGGLIKETVEVLISNEGKVSFNDIEQMTLYHYQCGIYF